MFIRNRLYKAAWMDQVDHSTKSYTHTRKTEEYKFFVFTHNSKSMQY